MVLLQSFFFIKECLSPSGAKALGPPDFLNDAPTSVQYFRRVFHSFSRRSGLIKTQATGGPFPPSLAPGRIGWVRPFILIDLLVTP